MGQGRRPGSHHTHLDSHLTLKLRLRPRARRARVQHRHPRFLHHSCHAFVYLVLAPLSFHIPAILSILTLISSSRFHIPHIAALA